MQSPIDTIHPFSDQSVALLRELRRRPVFVLFMQDTSIYVVVLAAMPGQCMLVIKHSLTLSAAISHSLFWRL
jgi:hypothetical protein